jgi:3-hydroxybutyryl-CoA dehydrogenase
VKDEILVRAKKLIASNLDTLIELGIVEKDQKEPILRRIHAAVKLEEAGQKADFVIEAIIEDQAAKKEMFSRLDRICPSGAILASNTSYMDIFKFVETKRPDKVLITHWFAPPHIVPLVEIVKGPQTSQEAVDRVKALMIRVGKKPIVITKFLPGFIANRLQSALGNEVFNLLDQGYASPEDIDTATKASFALRMPILGLVKRMDFTGLDLTQKILSNQTYKVPPQNTKSRTVDQLVSKGKLGVKSGSGYYEYGGRSTEEIMKERDMKLIRLREFLKEMGEL